MTPPKPPEFRLRDPLSPLWDNPEPFTFGQPSWLITDPAVTQFIPKSFGIGPLYIPNSTFLYPKLFGPKPTGTPTPPPPTTPSPWKPSDTGQLVTDIVMAIDSLDVDLNDMSVNGGEKGCRYSEVVSAEKYKAGKELCKNKFDAGTLADAHVEVRPVEGKTFSEFHNFTVLYKKYPGRAGSRINGFYLTHPADKNAQGPLSFDKDDPFESGKDFRDAANFSSSTPIGQSVANSDKGSRLIMRPIGWLYDEGPGISFDISENMLKAWGILDKDVYKNFGIEPFQIPRRLDRLWRLLPMPRPHNPDYIIADGCYDKLPGAKYVRPNSINAKPDLIAWTSPASLSAELRFKKTSIPLAGRGHIDLGDKGINRIKVNGDAKGLTVEIELKDIASFRFNQGGYAIGAKGLKAGKIVLNLPPLADIMKEFSSPSKTHAEKTLDCEKKAELKKKASKIAKDEGRNLTDVLDQLEMEAAADLEAKTPKKDHSAFFEKLFANIQVAGIEADEMTFERPDRGLKATLTKPVIKSATINGTSSIAFSGISSDGFVLEDDSTKIKASFGKSYIEEVKLGRGESGPIFDIKGLKGKDLSVKQDNGGLVIDDGKIGNIHVDLGKKDQVSVGFTDAVSTGKIDFTNEKEGYEFHTSGSSTISSFNLDFKKDSSLGDKIATNIKFSGEVKDFSLKHPKLGDFKLADTTLGESTFELGIDFPPAGSDTKPVDRYKVDINLKKATLKSGHIAHAEIGESKVTDGRIQLEKGETPLSGKVSGNLDINIKSVEVPLVPLGLKGFSIEGTFKDIGIKGAGVLEISPELIQLHKLTDTDKPGELKITGLFAPLLFKDDPSERKSELKSMAGGSAIKTNMDIESAKLEVQDLDGFEFIRPDSDVGRKADLRKLKVKNISLTDIQASAKIWAKFPIFGWLRGTFPKIGTVTGKIPDEKVSSTLSLDTLDISTDESGKTTQIVNLLIQLFEVGGQTQKAKFRLPSLTLSPKIITTGKDPIELELYFKDLSRGGDFDFSLEDEDLSHRGTRPKKK